VRDFAVDLSSGRIGYVVISVGSFLIEDSLIAVDPRALRESADADGRLVLEASATALRSAPRFAAGDWPLGPDVVAEQSAQRSAAQEDGDEPAAGQAQAAESGDRDRGIATISDGLRTATLTAGDRTIRLVEPVRQAGAGDREATGNARNAPTEPPKAGDSPEAAAADNSGKDAETRFQRLDRNGDGVLDRAEIAHELGRRDSYSDVDLNDDGVIQAEEFETLKADRADSARP